MISKFLLVFLGILIILSTTYGQTHHHRRNRTSTMTHTTIGINSTIGITLSTVTSVHNDDDDDDYYDYYDYFIGYGYKHKTNKTFLYCFILISIFVNY